MTDSSATTEPRVYLFDWGDTLMVDDPDAHGKMCDWPRVEAIPGAEQTLRCLSRRARVYVATGARDSTEADIWQALARVGLDSWISGIFCQANLGMAKGDPGFLPTILQRLSVAPNQVVMVGDSLNKDVMPARLAGITPVWFNRTTPSAPFVNVEGNARERFPEDVRVIRHLAELV